MRQRTGKFYLESSHIADSKAKHPTQSHHAPEVDTSQFTEVIERSQLAGEQQERQKQDAGIDVVIERQAPNAVVHGGQHLFGVYSVERDTEAGQDSKGDTSPRQGAFCSLLINTKPETTCKVEKDETGE